MCSIEESEYQRAGGMSQAPKFIELEPSEDASPGPSLGLRLLQHLKSEGEAGGGEDSVLLLRPPGQPSHTAAAVSNAAQWAEINQWERNVGAVSQSEDESEQLSLHLILELHLVPLESQTRQVRGDNAYNI